MSSIVNRFSKLVSKYMSVWLVLAMDVILGVIASGCTMLVAILVMKVSMPRSLFFILWISLSIIFSTVASLVTGSNKIIIRHSSFRDIAIFIAAAFIKVALILGIFLIIAACGSHFVLFHDLIVLILSDFVLTLFLQVGVRILMVGTYSVLASRIQEGRKCMRVLVYSTSEKSVSIVTRLQKSPHYMVVGFISSDKYKKSFTISGLPVYCPVGKDGFDELHDSVSFDAILFSSEGDIKKENGDLIDYATKASVKVLVAPVIDDLPTVHSHMIREVKIEDLLGRDQIRISLNDVVAYFTGKTVMVTGAAGSIGSELCRKLAGFGVGCLILYDNAETPMHNLRLELSERFPNLKYVPVIGDVRFKKRLDFAFRAYHPQIVFHAAAYKHVPLMEENPCEAVLVNVAGSRNVADKCVEYDVDKMVMISTDKAVNPTNIMGCTKRLAEIYVQSLGLAIKAGKVPGKTQFVTTRFGNVLGSNGSVIPRFREQIAAGGPVTVTHKDITRFFMTIPEACLLVMEAAIMPTENRICVFDMGEPVKIDLLARKMIELAGMRPDEDIEIKYVGLRPGEKLYEEVLSTVENTDPTTHDRIRVARVRSYEYADALKAVERLEELSRDVDISTMVRYMKSVVPEYISKNSRFSEYDNER